MICIESTDGYGLGIARHLQDKNRDIFFKGIYGDGIVNKQDAHPSIYICANKIGLYSKASQQFIESIKSNINFNRGIALACGLQLAPLTNETPCFILNYKPVWLSKRHQLPNQYQIISCQASKPNIMLVSAWFNGIEFLQPAFYSTSKYHILHNNDMMDLPLLTNILRKNHFIGCFGIYYNSDKQPIKIGLAPITVCELFFETSNIAIEQFLPTLFCQGIINNAHTWNVGVAATLKCEALSPIFNINDKKHLWEHCLIYQHNILRAATAEIGTITAHGRNFREAERRIQRFPEIGASDLSLDIISDILLYFDWSLIKLTKDLNSSI